MSQKISLKEAERKAFTTSFQDGLWDIFLGCFFLMFAIGPFLSPHLGDFWSSVVFVPFWGLVWLVIWLVRRHVVTPRLGKVKFGSVRKARLMKFSLVMLVINIIIFILGMVASLTFGNVPGGVFTSIFGLSILVCFTIAGYFLDFPRLYFYGLLVAGALPVGEWLYQNLGAAHHGLPITFGITSGIMILIGIILFVRLLQTSPPSTTPTHEEM